MTRPNLKNSAVQNNIPAKIWKNGQQVLILKFIALIFVPWNSSVNDIRNDAEIVPKVFYWLNYTVNLFILIPEQIQTPVYVEYRHWSQWYSAGTSIDCNKTKCTCICGIQILVPMVFCWDKHWLYYRNKQCLQFIFLLY